MKILAIIPAYNEAGTIKDVVANIQSECPECDYVVINDGSKDETLEVCRRDNLNYINLPVNLGLAGAFQAGMRYAYYNNYDYAVQIDGDGQHDAKYIQALCDCAMSGGDIVIGSRFVSARKTKSARMVGSTIIGGCIWLTTGKKISDPTSGMRMYSKKVMKRLATEMNFAPEPDTLAFLLRCGYKVKEVQVSMHERTAGESYLNLTSSIKYMAHICLSILIVQWFRGKVK